MIGEDMGIISAMRRDVGVFLGLNHGAVVGPCSHDVFIFDLTSNKDAVSR